MIHFQLALASGVWYRGFEGLGSFTGLVLTSSMVVTLVFKVMLAISARSLLMASFPVETFTILVKHFSPADKD